MEKIIELTRIDPGAVAVDGKQPLSYLRPGLTRLGRWADLCNYTDRPLLAQKIDGHQDALLVLGVEEVSRNHALIDFNPNGVFLTDLYSSNGTKVNGISLARGDDNVELHNDDVIILWSVQFHLRIVDASSVPANKALLVGHDGKNLGDAPINDVRAMEKALMRRKFTKEAITVLVEKDATSQRILDYLTYYQGQLLPGGLFIFHFSGHGSPKGIYVESSHSNRTSELVAFNDIMRIVAAFRSEVLMILDGCDTAKSFSNSNVPPNVCLIGHTTPAYQGIIASLLGDEFCRQGHTTRAITRILNDQRNRINVNDLVQALRRDLRVSVRQNVAVEGHGTMELPTVLSVS